MKRFLEILLKVLSGPMLMGGGDPPPQTSTTTVQQQYNPEEQARRNQVIDTAQGIYNKNAGAYSSIMNPYSAPVGPSADTKTGQDMVRAAATGSGQGIADYTAGATQYGLSGAALNPDSNPGLKASIDSAVRRVGTAYTDPNGVLAKIRGNFTGGNSGGTGTREGIASGIAGREYLNTVGDVTGAMTSDAYNKGLDLMKTSMMTAPGAYNLQLQPGAAVSAVGNQQEQYSAAQNDYNAAGTQWNLNKDWSALGPWANIVTGMSNPSTMTSATAPGARSGPTQALGGMLMGGAMASMMGVNPMVGAGAMLAMNMFR